MAQIIKIKRSTTPGNAPGTLQTGELAINVTDGSLFFGSATTVYDSFKFGGLDVTNDLTVVGEVYADMIKRESSNSNTTKIKSSANKWEIYAGNSSDEVMKVESSGVALRSDLLVSGTTTLRNDLNINGGDISFADNSKAIFGVGDDLKIYHSGSHSIIQDAGIGDLLIKGSIIKIKGTTAAEDCAIFTEDAGVELYYDNVKKFETTTDGVTMAGEIEMAASKITGLAEPTADEDAATKSYVDSQTHTDGTVTSVGTTGTVNGITLTGGDITSTGTITLGGTLGGIANSQLTNDSVSYGGVSLDLGGTDATPAFNLSDATAYPGTNTLITTGTITSGIWNSQRLFTKQTDENATMGDYVTFGGEVVTVPGLIYYYYNGAWALANAATVDTGQYFLAVAMGESTSSGMMVRGMVGMLAYDPGDDGDVLYLSETDGQVTNVAPTSSQAVVRVVGYALDDAPSLWFNPDNTWVELS